MALALLAPAKINLTLEVLRRRPDGYHEIASISQTLALGDRVVVESAEVLTLATSGPHAWSLPAEPANDLAYRAGVALQRHARVELGASIRIEKNIPVTAGLGGGSSDAAAVLRGLNRIWRLGLAVSELCRVGAAIGSDVPLFLHGGTCEVGGRGELTEPLPDLRETPVILLVSSITIEDKTRRMYTGLDESAFSNGGHMQAVRRRLDVGAPIEGSLFFNAFEASAGGLFPALPPALAACRAEGLAAGVCGSGPSIYVWGTRHLGSGLTSKLAGLGYTPMPTRTLRRSNALATEVV